ncbi:MAG: thioredoxin domain-containing protein [Nitrospirae bacterium]|nr:thioredoxin domain-containing protein [Nitrospirota bacterium]
MIFKKLLVTLLFLVMLPFSAYAVDSSSIKGAYTQLPESKFTFDGEKVEVVEFLSFYCAHCYEFEKSVPVIKGNFPKKIKWKIVPVFWGKGSPKPGEAYLLAEESGKGEQMKKALFDSFFLEKKEIGDVEVLENIGTQLGLGFDFSRRLRAGEKAKDIGEALIMMKTYNIEETPTLIIAGNLKVSPSMAGPNVDAFRENVITIIKSILKGH